ncbi:MAG: hypothetical protein ACHQVK_02645 [Candidatus Paceibacterales bacterium]
MRILKIKIITAVLLILALMSFSAGASAQELIGGLKLNPKNQPETAYNKLSLSADEDYSGVVQKPTKKIYFVPGGKIGMFFLQSDFSGNQMIALEAFGKFVGDGFFAELSLPFRFKTSPAFTDIGIDINVLYPFLGPKNKSEVEPYIGGGLGLHFIGRDDGVNGTRIAARGGMGLNIIAGTTFFKNYDFNIMVELKYFNYLREFDDQRYQGIGLNVGATFPR